jgi:hypothetical protein
MVTFSALSVTSYTGTTSLEYALGMAVSFWVLLTVMLCAPLFPFSPEPPLERQSLCDRPHVCKGLGWAWGHSFFMGTGRCPVHLQPAVLEVGELACVASRCKAHLPLLSSEMEVVSLTSADLRYGPGAARRWNQHSAVRGLRRHLKPHHERRERQNRRGATSIPPAVCSFPRAGRPEQVG